MQILVKIQKKYKQKSTKNDSAEIYGQTWRWLGEKFFDLSLKPRKHKIDETKMIKLSGFRNFASDHT